MASSYLVDVDDGLRKQDLIFRIEQKLLEAERRAHRRRRARDPARGLRLPAQPGLELPRTVPTTSTSRRRRSSGSICGPATWCRARCARQRSGSAISRCSRSRGSTADPPEVAKARVAVRQPAAALSRGRLRLETQDGDLSMRVMDLIAPIGKGQRGLIVVAAARRQDDPAPEDRQRHRRESSRGDAHRAADRRAAGGGHRHASPASTRK